jgi:hypothetical protein
VGIWVTIKFRMMQLHPKLDLQMKKNEERITSTPLLVPFLITTQDQYEPAVFRQVFDSLTILGFFL